jgi:lysophospholipase L1-like esterase
MAVTIEDYAFFAEATLSPHDDGNRHGLPSMARLADGRILAAWSRYKEGSSDFGVVGACSSDGGCSWTPPQVLIDHKGLLDADPSIVVSGDRVLVTATTVSFAEGIRSSVTSCIRSEDSGKTWSEVYEIPMNHRYTCGKCHRGLRLKSGTLLMGYSWDVICEQGRTLQSEGQMDLRAGVMRSTDNGITWTNGGDTHATYEKIAGGAVSGTDEPAIVELEAGSIYMLMRTGSTHLYEARSKDEGKTWHDIQPSPLTGTNAPAALTRFEVKARNGILAVWDNAKDRFPLCAAASFDGGRTWTKPKDIAQPYTSGQASYPSCDQAPDGTLLAVWQQDLPGGRVVRLARFSLAWLLQEKPAAPPPPAPALKPMTIVLFGESTTAPRGPLRVFGQLLEQDLPAHGIQPKIINRGAGGEITAAARERFDRDVLVEKPDVVTIYYGLNDAAVDVWKGATAPRVPVKQFEENLRYFVGRLKAQGARPILLTPNPCAWTAQERELYGKPPYNPGDPDGHNVVLKDYVNAVRAVAHDEQTSLLDVFKIFQDYAGGNSLQDLLLDGVHPNDLGHRIIADGVLQILSP